jgi:hypothetical protein
MHLLRVWVRVGLLRPSAANVRDTLLAAVRAKPTNTSGKPSAARAAVALPAGRFVRAAARLLTATSDLLLGARPWA